MIDEEKRPKVEAEKPQIEAVIFDLDGVLIDSEPVWNRAFDKFIEEKGVSLSPDVSSSLAGVGIREIVETIKEHSKLKGETLELMEEFRGIFYQILFESGNYLNEGVKELLLNLKGKYRLALATGGHTREMALKLLSKSGIDEFFEVVISSDDVKRGKPHDVYVESARKLGIDPTNCAVIEDSVNGVLAAKAAGMRIIGFNDHYRFDINKLYRAGANRAYTRLSDIRIEDLYE